jgi:hypothetical protein
MLSIQSHPTSTNMPNKGNPTQHPAGRKQVDLVYNLSPDCPAEDKKALSQSDDDMRTTNMAESH